ncbi:hypothetical protein F5Y17DRAFT_164197 [Xylariaceae sp. FL0594]|nr:hypothetical protein F5Y17DRAFT_164197 [Xylariaceae sp. FL0594]
MQLLNLLPLVSAAAAVQVGVLNCPFVYKDGALYVSDSPTTTHTADFYVDADSRIRRLTYLGASGSTYKFHAEPGFMTVDTTPGAFKPIYFAPDGSGGDNNHWDNWLGFVAYTPVKGKQPKSFIGGFQYAGADKKLYWNQTLYESGVVDSGSVKNGFLFGQCHGYTKTAVDNV